MKNKKGLALLLSAALLFTTAMPGTLAISSSTASSATTLTTASDPAPAPDTTPDVTATPDATTTPDATVAPDSTAAPENDTTPAPDSTFDVAAAYEYVMGLASDEEVDTYLASLTEDEYAQLKAYVRAKVYESAPNIISEVFTEAGPFLPAVNVGSQIIKPRRAARTLAAAEEPERVDNNGIITSKVVVPNEDENGNPDGTYTLRLESYVTGTTTTTTTTTSIPVDIVLVLDQSGSMADNFEGESTNNNSERRQYALKVAVNKFIDEVADKYSEDCDNRMAIVTYGTNATIMRGWTVVNEESKESLKNGDSSSRNVIDGINKLPDEPSGATNTAAGVQMAEVLLSDTSKKVNVHTAETDYWGNVTKTYDTSYDGQYTYSGQNTNRQKVVIVFTDGVPTMATDFDTTVATKAIASAKNLKDAGVGATIYSVGIFNGVKPEQMYGAEGFSKNSDGSIGSNWSDFSFWMIGDIQSYDIPAGNRFLNLLSSNFKDADEIGIEKYKKTIIGIGYRGWEITKNFDRTASNYYLTASDSDSLSEIFTTISQNIQTGSASVQLGSETKVQDVISNYFELPTNADASSITVKTAPYTSEGEWGEENVDSQLTRTISNDGKTITVTGFDFSQNYCSKENGRQDGDNNQPGNFYGRKLIIEIPIKVREGFLGGNDVPTNTTGSAIIAVGDNGTTQVMEQFEVPTTNVEIATPQFNTNSVTIYEGNSVETKSLYTLPSFNDEDDWKDDYVTINGSESQNVTPTDCTEYTVTVTYTPTSQGNSNSFAPVSANSNTGTATV
ncbi:MAG: VWA domain-containing protein, partial [Oscillospiraceae bacterium]|nr:VWA domain-containing protein [Oscillospiraceae bacterium]